MTTYFEFRSIAELLEDNCDFDSEQKELIQSISEFRHNHCGDYNEPLLKYAMRNSKKHGHKASCKCQECMLAGVLAGLEEILIEYIKQIQEWQAKLLECPGAATGGVEITGGTAAKTSLGGSPEELELAGGAGLGVSGGAAKAGGAAAAKAGGAAVVVPHQSKALGGAGHPESTEIAGGLSQHPDGRTENNNEIDKKG